MATNNPQQNALGGMTGGILSGVSTPVPGASVNNGTQGTQGTNGSNGSQGTAAGGTVIPKSIANSNEPGSLSGALPGQIPNQQPGMQGFNQNQGQSIIQQTGQLLPGSQNSISAPYGQFGIGASQQNLSNYELALQTSGLNVLNSQAAQNQAAEQNVLPQSYSYNSNVINPVTQQSYGSGAAGQGGAFAGGQQMGNNSLGQQFNSVLSPAYTTAGTIKNNYQQFLQNNPRVNSSPVNYYNAAKSWIAGGNFTDPAYPEQTQFINEFLGSLAPIIGASGNPTDMKQQMVNAFINGSSQGQSISQQMDNAYSIASGKMNDIYNSGQSTGNPTAGGNGAYGNNGSTTSAGNYVFSQDAQGNWQSQ
jgi:hypothetical protein